MPAVSVLLVFHRDTPFLRPAIASVLGQTWRDLELVLVDNGTGLAPEALGELGRDPRLHWVRLPANAGIPGGHNAGVAAARGELVALLDYDDLARPARLERQVAALQADPALGLVSSRVEVIDAAGQVRGAEFCVADAAAARAYTEFAAPVVTPAFAGRRAVFAQLAYRPEFTFSADFDFLARAAERFPFGHVPEMLLHYRRHAGQTTAVQAARIAAERCVVRLLAARRRAGRPEGDDWRACLRDAVNQTTDEAQVLREFARRFLAEGLWMQAAYHARRSFAVRRTPGGLLAALSLGGQAWRGAGAQRHAVTRMFWRGPVKALGLRRA